MLELPEELDLENPPPIPVEEPLPKEEVLTKVDDEEVEKALEDLLKSARNEDKFVRDDQLLLWKRLEYYWNNILDIFFDPIARDWRIPDWKELEEEGEVPARLINIYRPHGESIVAALSVAIPSVIFHPDDADVPEDVEAAKAYRNLADLLALHNDAPMLFIRALVIMFNQGTIFGYNYYHKDPKYGVYEVPRVDFKDIEIFNAYCPECGEGLDAGAVPPAPQGNPAMQSPQGNPPAPAAPPQMGEPSYQCQNCGYNGPADITQSVEKLPQIVGYDKSPKGTIKQEVFSGLNVKVPIYAKNQDSCGYLLLEFAQSVAMLRSIFPAYADKIVSRQDNTWETFQKIPVHYYGMMPDNAANVSCIWFRTTQFWQYYSVDKKDVVQELLRRFPEGCYAIFVNDEFMEAHSENMDEHWTISDDPLSGFIYARPLGENLATVQDLRAELVEIEVQTAEHGIPETYADGKVLDFEKYGEGRSKPGMVTQVNPRPGKGIGDAFFTSKPAILSQEIDPLRQHLDQDAQFVVGDFPSVYGGPAIGGSRTASEYAKSQAAALQRLGNIWKILNIFWANFQSKATVELANVLRELNQDERFTKREGKSNFINVWIRSTSLGGKVGRVEPEASEQLPTSWAQKKDAITALLTLQIPEILQALLHPRNIEVLKSAYGLTDIYVPGEEDRLRQFQEFSIMSQGVPVQTNPLIDNADIHIEILQSILEGPIGDFLDPQAREVCMMHLQEHMQYQQQKQEDDLKQQIKVQKALKPAKSGSPGPEKGANNGE